jgi:hypothetical protein
MRDLGRMGMGEVDIDKGRWERGLKRKWKKKIE